LLWQSNNQRVSPWGKGRWDAGRPNLNWVRGKVELMPAREHVYRSIVKTFAERRMIWAERSPRKTAFTVRMWRARLLTFTAVAAAIADRAVGLMGGREDLRLSVRLAFERLFRGLNALPADCDAWKGSSSRPTAPGKPRWTGTSPWESVYFLGNCTDQPSRSHRLTHAYRKLT
jgi:hypothetical protein